MKKTRVVFVMLVLIAAVCVLTGCNDKVKVPSSSNPTNPTNPTNPETPLNFLISDEMAKATVDITGATQLAIISSISSDGSRDVGGIRIERPHLAKSNDGVNFSEVKIQLDEDSSFISEDSASVEIYKMNTIKDYTVVSYISSALREKIEPVKYQYDPGEWVFQYPYVSENKQTFDLYVYDVNESGLDSNSVWYNISTNFWVDYYSGSECKIYDITKGVPIGFNERGFFSNDLIKSYLIDNSTGKMYSLDILPAFDIVGGMIAVRKCSNSGYFFEFYKINIYQGDLLLTKVITNPDIVVRYATSDKYGWTFINNNQVNDIDVVNKIIYLKSNDIDYVNMFVDSSNTVYISGTYDSEPEYEFVDGVKTAIGDNIPRWHEVNRNDYFFGWSTIQEYCGLKNGYLIRSNLYSEVAKKAGSMGWGGDEIRFSDYSSGNCYFNDDFSFIFEVNNGDVTWMKMDWDSAIANGQIENNFSTPILSNVVRGTYFEMQGNQIVQIDNVFKQITMEGTVYYRLGVDETGNSIKAYRISTNVTPVECYVIHPLI